MRTAFFLLLTLTIATVTVGLAGWPYFSRFIYRQAEPVASGYLQNGPIHFYGRVVDQNGRGVPDAIVQGEYSVFSLAEHIQGHTYTPHPLHVTTDSLGNFTITDLQGQRLVWNAVLVPGYVYLQPLRVYVYYNDAPPIFTPNPAAPEIFTVWRRSASPAHLLSVRAVKDITAPGKTFSIWLGTPSRIREGVYPDCDLQFTLNYTAPPDDGTRGAPPPFDWSFVIDVPNGGIIATHDAYLYEAPGEGYQSHYEFQQHIGAPNWNFDNRNQQKFYLKSRSGQAFSALNITASARPRLDSAFFSIGGIMNDQGSTNLEPSEINTIQAPH